MIFKQNEKGHWIMIGKDGTEFINQKTVAQMMINIGTGLLNKED